MFKAFEFCIPTKSTIVPHGPDWLHEIKYDGYRLRLERDADRVRLITRGGYDWTQGRLALHASAARHWDHITMINAVNIEHTIMKTPTIFQVSSS